jgi:hypothetical protein
VVTATKVKTVPVDKETTLSIKIEGGKEGDPATFEIKNQADDSAVDSVDGTIKKGTATCKWKAKGPTPEGEERTWRVYFTCTVNEVTATSEEFIVYLDKCEVETVDADGAVLKDVAFEITAGDDPPKKVKRSHSGSAGKVTVDGLPPGALEFSWHAPARFISFETDQAGKKKAKLKAAPKAVLLFPEANDAGHVQLVNHKPAKGHEEYGSKLTVRVGVDEADGGSKKGDVIYLKAVWAAEADLSKRTTPKRNLVGGKKLPWSGDDLGKVVKIKEDGGEAHFELELGYAGGDKVTIHVGGTDTTEDDSIEVENSRKLYYQVTHRKTLATLPDLSRLATSLEAVHVEYESYGVETFEEGEKGVPTGTFFDGTMVGKAGQRLVCIGDHNKKWFHSNKFKDTKKPLGVHVLLCDAQYDGGTPNHHVDVHAVVMEAAFVDVTSDRHVFQKALQDEKSPLIVAEWASTAPSGHPDHGKKGKLTQANVVIEHETDPHNIHIDLPGDAALIVGDSSGPPKDAGTKHKIKVKLKLKVCFGEFLGESDHAHGNWQLIAIMEETATNDVMAHELGHTMNQVVKQRQSPPPGLKLADHGRQYNGKGHQGSHCADGMSDGDYGSLADFTGKAECKCIMYGENDPAGSTSNGSFCDRCKPFLTAERLTTL